MIKNRFHRWSDAKHWLSIKMAPVMAAIWWAILASPDTIAQVIGSLPPALQGAFPPFVAFGLVGTMTFLRLWKQKPKGETDAQAG